MAKVNTHDIEELIKFNSIIRLDSFSFLQQESFWANLSSNVSGDEVALFLLEDEKYKITATTYLFKSRLGNFLVSNVQAGSIGCISYIGEESYKEKAYLKLVNEIFCFANDNNCITLTLTTNPYSKDENFVMDALNPDSGMKSFISFIEIDRYFDDLGEGGVYLTSKERSNLKRNVKKANKNHFEFFIDNSYSTLEEWYLNIHCRRILELGGNPLPFKLFHNIYSEENIQSNFIFFACRKNDKLVSGDLCIFNKVGNLDNFMMSTDSDYLNEGVNYFMVDNILKWCLLNGIKRYNWQSSNPPKGGIFEFKKSWGSITSDYFYYTKILQKEKFEKLIKEEKFEDLINTTNGHFIAPFHTIKKGLYGVLSKEEINLIANIYQK